MTDEKLSTTIVVNGKEYSKIELKGRKLFEFMQLARGKNIDRKAHFRNLEFMKYSDTTTKLSERVHEKIKKIPKAKQKKFEWYIENDPEFKDEFKTILLNYMLLLTTEINKVLVETNYDDLVEIISIGFEIDKETVEEFTEDNFMTAIAIINDALPSA